MTKSKIIECITFCDNNLIFEMRYNILVNYVDYFLVLNHYMIIREKEKNLILFLRISTIKKK